jgi:hypothetical protein
MQHFSYSRFNFLLVELGSGITSTPAVIAITSDFVRIRLTLRRKRLLRKIIFSSAMDI